MKINIGCFLLLVLLAGCKKYLDAKTDKALEQPSGLSDAQALLDSYTAMNTFYPYIGAESDDDHFLLDVNFNALRSSQQDAYTWAKDAFFNNTDVCWKFLYTNILSANMALETVQKTPRTAQNTADADRIKGEALFFRAFNLFYVIQYWAAPYDSTTAGGLPGIPLRLTSDINEPVSRPSLDACYAQVINDLTEAAQLLPVSHEKLFRPSGAAAFGLLARVYLVKGDYNKALENAQACLQLYSTLIDYNTISTTAGTPFKSLNDEVIFHAEAQQESAIYSPTAKVDTTLYASYNDSDLRKQLFFYGSFYKSFKGSYAGSNYFDVPFIGIAADEQYLIKAECSARLGQTGAAMDALNTLLVQRWKTNTFIPLTANSADSALRLVLQERRKELIGRGMRWLDLRRLNRDPRFSITLTRSIGGIQYSLPPNDPRYTFYIPDIVIKSSGIQQNTR